MATPFLTVKQIENAKPKDKPYKLATGRGFYVYISPNGKKTWRYDYRHNGKRNTVTYGEYPLMSLLEAQAAHDESRKMLKAGLDPNKERKRAKVESKRLALANSMTFERVAYEWLEKRKQDKAERYRHDTRLRLENHIFPYIGAIPFADLETQDFLVPLRKVEARGSLEMAHRLGMLIKQIARYAKVAGYAKHNEAADIGEALQKRGEQKHMAAIVDARQFGTLLNDMDAYKGDISTRYALKLLPYVFVRSGELRGARWEEFDFTQRQWVIPAERMKMKQTHVVPLARQVVSLLCELREWNGSNALLFPGQASSTRPITDMCLLNALRRLGYGRDTMTIHGFRGTASTMLNEQGYRSEVIEAQLAHKERNKIREAYNHAVYLPERVKMMQEWADYLDTLKAAAQ